VKRRRLDVTRLIVEEGEESPRGRLTVIFVGGVLGPAIVDVVALEGLVDAVSAARAEEAVLALRVLSHFRPDGPKALLTHGLVGRQEAEFKDAASYVRSTKQQP
jgi:hypothetical protein